LSAESNALFRCKEYIPSGKFAAFTPANKIPLSGRERGMGVAFIDISG
jgi:hypothetical protein